MQALQAPLAAPGADAAAAVPQVPQQVLEPGPGPQDPARPAGGAARLAEIQRAHDILVAVILDEQLRERMFHGNADTNLVFECLKANADVLCWALGHRHNTTFESNLKDIERAMQELGYVLHDAGRPLPPGERP
jgi:hypothetical protein